MYSSFLICSAFSLATCGVIGSEGVAKSDARAVLTLNDLEKISKDLSDMENSLVRLVAKSCDGNGSFIDSDSLEVHALKLLGALRSRKARFLCARNIHVVSTLRAGIADTYDLSYYPFALALMQIGRPALSLVLEYMKKEKVGSTKFQLSCLVVQVILGKKIARIYLESLRLSDKAFADKNRFEHISVYLSMGLKRWRSKDPYSIKSLNLRRDAGILERKKEK